MNKLILLCLLLIASGLNLYAQKAPIKFGKIDKKDLEMTVYEADTSAAAVILCDYGYFDATRFQMERVVRIKILKKEGLEWANKSFRTYSKSYIRGTTFNLENGEIVKTDLQSKTINKQKVTDDIYIFKVNMPNVKVGSVIDIEFSEPGFPLEWYFQYTIPVKWSELIVESSIYITYRKNFFGYQPLTVKEDGRWVAALMPAFKEEPYMTSVNNCLTHFEFDIISVKLSTFSYSLATSWNVIRDNLLGYDYFGSVLAKAGYMKDIAANIKLNAKTEDEKIMAAYETIKKIKWDEVESLTTDVMHLETAYERGSGNSAEINLMLVQLLRKLDFDALPLIMSTHENGILSPVFPSLNKLNYVIAAVILPKDTLLLDATEKYMPYYLLPKRTLNFSGLMVDMKRCSWVDLETNKKDLEFNMYQIKLDEEDNLTGTINSKYSDYAAYKFRKYYAEYNDDEEYQNEYLEDNPGLTIKEHTITDLDSIYKPVQETFEIQLRNQVMNTGEEIYINPLLLHKMTENPFKLEERKYMVDFTYLKDKSFLVNISYPANYTIVKLPESVVYKMQGSGISYSCKSSGSNGQIQLLYQLKINKRFFMMNEYKDLKRFYDQMILKQNESIVLKKV